jgi:hypothetical protein
MVLVWPKRRGRSPSVQRFVPFNTENMLILTGSNLGINVYSSKDLLNWKNEGKALSPINGTEIAPERVVERPKVVYNEPTKTWVVGHCVFGFSRPYHGLNQMWFHADNSSYGLLRQGVATSQNVAGMCL